jgi:hypothetical protein
LNTNIEDA